MELYLKKIKWRFIFTICKFSLITFKKKIFIPKENCLIYRPALCFKLHCLLVPRYTHFRHTRWGLSVNKHRNKVMR